MSLLNWNLLLEEDMGGGDGGFMEFFRGPRDCVKFDCKVAA